MAAKNNLKNKVLTYSITALSIFSAYNCTGPKQLGDSNTYQFKNQELKFRGDANFTYQEAPDSSILKYSISDSNHKIYIKIPSKNKIEWFEKIKDKTISFEAKKITRAHFDDYFDVNEKTIEIKK